MTKATNIASAIKYPFVVFLGGVAAIGIITVTTLSLPVILYRQIVKLFAKMCRPELGSIFSGLSALLVTDYFSKHNPRANLVLALVLDGRVNCEKVQNAVLQSWIPSSGSIPASYAKFQQYPVRWLGFTFWKNAMDTFDINNHVSLVSPTVGPVTEFDLDAMLEELINSKFPSEQSPWQVLIVENYTPDFITDKQHSVVILRWNHFLADGLSMMIALLKIVYKDFTMDKLEQPNIQFPQRNLLQKVLFVLAFPLNLFQELGETICHFFQNGPFKVPDSHKSWHQVFSKSKPVSIDTIKQIKNQFGVSFTSVLISALSAGLQQFIKENQNTGNKKCKTTPFYSVLPISGAKRQPGLTNYCTTAGFDLPVSSFVSPGARLQHVHKQLVQKRDSVLPYLAYYIGLLFSYNLHPVIGLMSDNKFASIGLTNVAGIPRKIVFQNATCIQTFAVAGGLPGEMGICFTVLSFDKEIRFHVSAESYLLSKEKAAELLAFVTDEIKTLEEENKYNNCNRINDTEILI